MEEEVSSGTKRVVGVELNSPGPLKPLPTGWENIERIASLNSYDQVLTEPVKTPWRPLSLEEGGGLLP